MEKLAWWQEVCRVDVWKKLLKGMELGPELDVAMKAGGNAWGTTVLVQASVGLRVMPGGEKALVKEKESKMWLLMEGLFLLTTMFLRFGVWGSWSVVVRVES